MTAPRSAAALLPLPEPARTDDGNAWFTGPCIYHCDGAPRRVLDIGLLRTTGHVDCRFTACGPCIERLHRWAWYQAIARDQEPPP